MSTLERTLHQHPLELAAAAVDGLLSPAETTELDSHLAGCSVCAGRAAAMHGDALALDQPFGPLPSRRVDDAVYAAIAGTARRRPQLSLMMVAAALLMVALVGLAVVGAVLLRPNESIPTTVIPSEPPAITSPAPTVPAPDASPVAPVAVTWQRLGTVPVDAEFFGAEASALREVAAIPAAYVGVGSIQSVQRSEDGRSWNAIDLPFEASKSRYGQDLDYNVNDIASSGGLLVIVGAYSHEPCTKPAGDTGAGPLCPISPISWVSDDGRTWHSSHPWAGPTPPAGYEQGSEFTAVWAVPTGGWDAALGYWQGEGLTGREIWHSDDGITWAPPPESMPVPTGLSEYWWPFEGEVADADGRRVVWERSTQYNESGGCPCRTDSWLSTSSDGRTWSIIETFPSTGAVVTAGLAPLSSGTDPWILIGSSTSDGGATYVPTIWVSTDLETWATIELPTSSAPAELCAALERPTPCSVIERVDAIVATDDGYVAVGALIDDGYGYARSAVWQSADGLSWVETDQPEFAITRLVDGPAGLLALGKPDRESTVATWLVR